MKKYWLIKKKLGPKSETLNEKNRVLEQEKEELNKKCGMLDGNIAGLKDELKSIKEQKLIEITEWKNKYLELEATLKELKG